MTHHVDLEKVTLREGAHGSREEGMCVMEAVAWFAGEPHSDSPDCASPIITKFAIGQSGSMTAGTMNAASCWCRSSRGWSAPVA